MKKLFFLLLIELVLVIPVLTLAEENSLANEESQGKTIWEKLQTKQVICNDLKDDDFELLGEYFMGQMMGDVHEAMNNMMKQMVGEQGEEQMHIVMGKRLSGCDTSATYPPGGYGFMPMMGMMGGYGWQNVNTPVNYGWREGMMGQGYYGRWPGMMGLYGGGTFWMILGTILVVGIWILIIVAIIALIMWLVNQMRRMGKGRKKRII